MKSPRSKLYGFLEPHKVAQIPTSIRDKHACPKIYRRVRGDFLGFPSILCAFAVKNSYPELT